MGLVNMLIELAAASRDDWAPMQIAPGSHIVACPPCYLSNPFRDPSDMWALDIGPPDRVELFVDEHDWPVAVRGTMRDGKWCD